MIFVDALFDRGRWPDSGVLFGAGGMLSLK